LNAVYFKSVNTVVAVGVAGTVIGTKPGSLVSINDQMLHYIIPSKFTVEQNYPNPFNSLSIIRFDLDEDEYVTLKVYDLLGREMLTMVNGYKTSGTHEVILDGSSLSGGVYFYKIQAGNQTQTKKFLLVK